VKAAEREAFVTFERLVNDMDAQGLQACASSIVMIGCIAWVLFRFKRVLTHLILAFHPAWRVGSSSSVCFTRNRSIESANILGKRKTGLFAMAEMSMSVVWRC